MKANRSQNTKPELAVRRVLFARGHRYRVFFKVRLPGRTVRPDIVFTRAKVAVFIDGCFWHGCPQHGRMPSDPTGYWRQKLDRNQARDQAVDRELHENGWTVVRIWEHTETAAAADIVSAAVESAPRSAPPPSTDP